MTESSFQMSVRPCHSVSPGSGRGRTLAVTFLEGHLSISTRVSSAHSVQASRPTSRDSRAWREREDRAGSEGKTRKWAREVRDKRRDPAELSECAE